MIQRNEAVDVLKGIGILMVLVAHSLGGYVSQFAYTFHMPLFFIVTGLFLKVPEADAACASGNICVMDKGLWQAVRKDFRRLIYPALFTTVVIMAVCALSYIVECSWMLSPLSFVYDAGADGVFDMLPPPPGNLWFLYALFFGRLSFYVVARHSRGVALAAVCLLSGGVAVLSSRLLTLPYSMAVGVSVLPFICIGYFIQLNGGVDRTIGNWWYRLLIPLWVAYIFLGRLQVGSMEYSWCYVFDILAAAGGTYFFYLVSKGIVSYGGWLKTVLMFFGTYSIILVCVPGVETYCFPMQEVIPQGVPFRQLFVLAGKVAWCALSMHACLRIGFLKKVFGVGKVNGSRRSWQSYNNIE